MSNATAAPSAPAASPAAAQAPVTAPCPASVSALFRSGAIDAVCFDVDSTICTTEGIDEFAAFLGCGDAVAQVTRKVRRNRSLHNTNNHLYARRYPMHRFCAVVSISFCLYPHAVYLCRENAHFAHKVSLLVLHLS